jgi:hypothetical protein
MWLDPSNSKCKLPMCSKCGGAYRIFVFCFIVLVAYWFFLKLTYKSGDIVHHDFMNRKVFDFSLLGNCCSWWPISHFILFFFLGLLFPDCDIPIISIGVFWELFEIGVGYSLGDEIHAVRRGVKNIEYVSSWWQGSMKDIVMDIAGFYLGKLIVKATGKQFNIPYITDCSCDNKEVKT